MLLPTFDFIKIIQFFFKNTRKQIQEESLEDFPNWW